MQLRVRSDVLIVGRNCGIRHVIVQFVAWKSFPNVQNVPVTWNGVNGSARIAGKPSWGKKRPHQHQCPTWYILRQVRLYLPLPRR